MAQDTTDVPRSIRRVVASVIVGVVAWALPIRCLWRAEEMAIIETLDTAERINVSLSKILAGEYPDDRRVTITLAYVNLSLDHHTAIILLFRKKLYGSGLALVRSIFEAMLRAHWVVGCATDTEVDLVAEDHNFDIMNRVDPNRIDKAFLAEGFFRQAKADARKAMNAYTHPGLRQLVRQFSGSKVEASYTEEDLVEGLRAATASILMFGYLLAKLTGRHRQALDIEDLFDESP